MSDTATRYVVQRTDTGRFYESMDRGAHFTPDVEKTFGTVEFANGCAHWLRSDFSIPCVVRSVTLTLGEVTA